MEKHRKRLESLGKENNQGLYRKRCFYRILSEAEVPAKTVLQINVVVDEISYEYKDGQNILALIYLGTVEKTTVPIIQSYFQFSNFLGTSHRHF